MNDLLLGNMTGKEDKRVNIKDILSFIFEKKGIEQQTIISDTNRLAIVKMRTTNKYLKSVYGFEIDLFQCLIDEVRINNISVKGRGRDDIIKAIEAMQDNQIIEEKKGLI